MLNRLRFFGVIVALAAGLLGWPCPGEAQFFIFGRKCNYPAIRSSNPSERAFNERAAINAPIQGSAADIMRRAMIRMDDALAKAGLSARMLLQVHDELVFEVPDAEVEATLPVVSKVMEGAPLPAIELAVPLAVDARAAQNWDEAH